MVVGAAGAAGAALYSHFASKAGPLLGKAPSRVILRAGDLAVGSIYMAGTLANAAADAKAVVHVTVAPVDPTTDPNIWLGDVIAVEIAPGQFVTLSPAVPASFDKRKILHSEYT